MDLISKDAEEYLSSYECRNYITAFEKACALIIARALVIDSLESYESWYLTDEDNVETKKES